MITCGCVFAPVVAQHPTVIALHRRGGFVSMTAHNLSGSQSSESRMAALEAVSPPPVCLVCSIVVRMLGDAPS